MKKSRWLLLLIPLLFVAIPVLRFVLAPEEVDTRVPGTPVRLGGVERTLVEEVLRYPGNLRPQNTTAVIPRVAGEVTRIHVSEGDYVTAGQLLVSIDDDVVRLQMEQARAARNAAQAQLDKARAGAPQEEIENATALVEQAEEELEIARTNLDRTERLFNAGTIARAQYEDAQNQFRAAETQVQNARRSLSLLEQGARDEDISAAEANAEAARKQFELAELQVGYAQVRAPVAGTVASIMVEEGNSVGVGTPVAALINDDLIYATIAVPEEHYGRLRVRGSSIEARVYPVAYEGRDGFPGRVSSVSSVIDAASRTFEVEVAVENRTGDLRPGMYANVELVLARSENAMVVPTTAVLFRNDGQVVFTAEAGSSYHARMVPVEVGVETGNILEIRSGLAEDARIVVEGNAFLEDGDLLRVLE